MPETWEFSDGVVLHLVLAPTQGWLIVSADVEIAGATPHLHDLGIAPLEKYVLKIGVAAVLNVRRELARQASQQGYTEVSIDGVRISGRHPNRPFSYQRRTT